MFCDEFIRVINFLANICISAQPSFSLAPAALPPRGTRPFLLLPSSGHSLSSAPVTAVASRGTAKGVKRTFSPRASRQAVENGGKKRKKRKKREERKKNK